MEERAVKRARSGSGLGDNIYLQSVVRYLVSQGERIEVCTSYPEVFLPIKDKVMFAEFSRKRMDYTCHYVMGKRRKDTTQWNDICDMARIPRAVPLRLDWKVTDWFLPNRVRDLANGRPVVLSLQHRAPMARTDGYGSEVLPSLEVRTRVLETLDCFVVEVGKGESLGELPKDLDWRNKTGIEQLIDLAATCDGMVGYPSFFVPLAESLGLPALFVWSSRINTAPRAFVRAIVPEKVLHQPNVYVWDDWDMELIKSRVREFRSILDPNSARAPL